MIAKASTWDIDLEVLCSLPVAPSYAHGRSLQTDFSIAHPADLVAIVTSISDRFAITIERWRPPRKDYIVYAISPASRDRAREVAEAYWAATHR